MPLPPFEWIEFATIRLPIELAHRDAVQAVVGDDVPGAELVVVGARDRHAVDGIAEVGPRPCGSSPTMLPATIEPVTLALEMKMPNCPRSGRSTFDRGRSRSRRARRDRRCARSPCPASRRRRCPSSRPAASAASRRVDPDRVAGDQFPGPAASELDPGRHEVPDLVAGAAANDAADVLPARAVWTRCPGLTSQIWRPWTCSRSTRLERRSGREVVQPELLDERAAGARCEDDSARILPLAVAVDRDRPRPLARPVERHRRGDRRKRPREEDVRVGQGRTRSCSRAVAVRRHDRLAQRAVRHGAADVDGAGRRS